MPEFELPDPKELQERGEHAFSRRVASIPVMTGMRTSITTTSGRSCPARRTAVAPSPASATTVMSGSASMSWRILWRTLSAEWASPPSLDWMAEVETNFISNTPRGVAI